MEPSRIARLRGRWRVGTRFAAAVGLLVVALLAVAAMGHVGQERTQAHADRMFEEHLRTIAGTAELADALHETEAAALQRAIVSDPATRAALDAELDELVPQADTAVQELRPLLAIHPDLLVELEAVDVGIDRFRVLRRSGAVDGPASATGPSGASEQLVRSTAALFAPLTEAADGMRAAEQQQAEVARQRADAARSDTRLLLAASVVLSLLVGLGVVLLLTRSMVPRIRSYADFATSLAADRRTEPLDVRGGDELAELGRALNAMVAQRALQKERDHGQGEFVDTLQMTSTEDEAHDLMTRHLERAISGSTAVVLQRNNSDNRLLAATPMSSSSDLPGRLVGAEPRSCLAVRFARTHVERTGAPALLDCTVCSGRARPSTCEPLLVSGSVIGAVLVEHDEATGPDSDVLRTTVAQAAPVLANLRNLSLAEFRANNDSLTGLPNRRATDDTLKRFIAQANRSLTPLAAVMVDLDHFKQINDRYGHGKGDEVLAAVGAALGSCLRDSDFAGRFGGEEFLVLLPDTGLEAAAQVADKLRAGIAAVRVTGLDRDITASAGVADLLEHGGNAGSLLREADRALYAAKAAGRNRTVMAPSEQGAAAAEDVGVLHAG